MIQPWNHETSKYSTTLCISFIWSRFQCMKALYYLFQLIKNVIVYLYKIRINNVDIVLIKRLNFFSNIYGLNIEMLTKVSPSYVNLQYFQRLKLHRHWLFLVSSMTANNVCVFFHEYVFVCANVYVGVFSKNILWHWLFASIYKRYVDHFTLSFLSLSLSLSLSFFLFLSISISFSHYRDFFSAVVTTWYLLLLADDV